MSGGHDQDPESLLSAQKEEAQAKKLVQQWEKVKEEVHALEDLEHDARKEVRPRAHPQSWIPPA